MPPRIAPPAALPAELKQKLRPALGIVPKAAGRALHKDESALLESFLAGAHASYSADRSQARLARARRNRVAKAAALADKLLRELRTDDHREHRDAVREILVGGELDSWVLRTLVGADFMERLGSLAAMAGAKPGRPKSNAEWFLLSQLSAAWVIGLKLPLGVGHHDQGHWVRFVAEVFKAFGARGTGRKFARDVAAAIGKKKRTKPHASLVRREHVGT